MPVYEFICEKCEHTFDVTASFFEDLEAPECPQCHGIETRKKYSFFMSSFGSSEHGAVSSCGGGNGRFT
jgi:putative FmdB family regulatory protein